MVLCSNALPGFENVLAICRVLLIPFVITRISVLAMDLALSNYGLASERIIHRAEKLVNSLMRHLKSTFPSSTLLGFVRFSVQLEELLMPSEQVTCLEQKNFPQFLH